MVGVEVEGRLACVMNKSEKAMLEMCQELYEVAKEQELGPEFQEFPTYGKFRSRAVGSKPVPFGSYVYKRSLLEARSAAFVLSFVHQVPAEVEIRGEGVGWVPVQRYEMPSWAELVKGGVS